MEYGSVTAPCGIDCFNCVMFEDLAQSVERQAFNQRYPRLAGVNCQGCRKQQCPMLPDACPTRACVQQRGHAYCHECADFPCRLLAPVADQAGRVPHNLKVYNLCRIKRAGVEKWAQQEARASRDRYFNGAFQIGAGQAGDTTAGR